MPLEGLPHSVCNGVNNGGPVVLARAASVRLGAEGLQRSRRVAMIFPSM